MHPRSSPAGRGPRVVVGLVVAHDDGAGDRGGSTDVELRAYTASTVAAYLHGTWKEPRVKSALSQLAAAESKEVPEETFRNLGPDSAVQVVAAAHDAQRQARLADMTDEQAKAVGREVAVEVAAGIREGKASRHGSAETMAIHELRRRAIESRVPKAERPTPQTPAYKTAARLLDYVSSFFTRQLSGGRTYGDLFSAVADNAGSPSFQPNGPNGPHLDLDIAAQLRELAARANDLADRIDGGRKALA